MGDVLHHGTKLLAKFHNIQCFSGSASGDNNNESVGPGHVVSYYIHAYVYKGKYISV